MAHCVASDEKFSLAIILMLLPLVGQLLHDRPGHIGRDPGHALEVGQVGQEARGDRRGISWSSSSFRSGNSA